MPQHGRPGNHHSQDDLPQNESQWASYVDEMECAYESGASAMADAYANGNALDVTATNGSAKTALEKGLDAMRARIEPHKEEVVADVLATWKAATESPEGQRQTNRSDALHRLMVESLEAAGIPVPENMTEWTELAESLGLDISEEATYSRGVNAVLAELRRRYGPPKGAMLSELDTSIDPHQISTGTDLARQIPEANPAAVETWLRRYRNKFPDCFTESESRRKNDPKYLYRTAEVLPELKKHFLKKTLLRPSVKSAKMTDG